MPRVKPFKYTYEKEIVMYAYFKKLDYFSTECKYSPFAARGFAREFVKDLEVGISGFANGNFELVQLIYSTMLKEHPLNFCRPLDLEL